MSNLADTDFFNEYSSRLSAVLSVSDWSPVAQLANDLQLCLK